MKIYGLQIANCELGFSHYFFAALRFCILIFAASFTVSAQSINIEFPTPVSANEINGTIPARDLGDARLTAYYYTFNGTQGDIFINVSASNFNGDIDVYVAEGLRPVTKISFYADRSANETGRVIYLRKPEKLILRVEGRSPDDNPATYKIKFAGSFVAVQDNGEFEAPKLPEVTSDLGGGVRVNSVGTIIKPKTDPTPETKETVAENEVDSSKNATPENTEPSRTEEPIKTEETEAETTKTETVAKTPARRPARRTGRGTFRTAIPSRRKPAPKVSAGSDSAAATPKPKTPAAPNPLENVRLLVLMKNGDKIEFPMSQVFRFTMNNGILVVVTKDGKIHRHSILDVQRLTVE